MDFQEMRRQEQALDIQLRLDKVRLDRQCLEAQLAGTHPSVFPLTPDNARTMADHQHLGLRSLREQERQLGQQYANKMWGRESWEKPKY